MDSSDDKVDSSEERLSSEEDPVDDPKDADFEVPDDDDEDEEEEDFMEEDEAPPRRRRSLPRGEPAGAGRVSEMFETGHRCRRQMRARGAGAPRRFMRLMQDSLIAPRGRRGGSQFSQT